MIEDHSKFIGCINKSKGLEDLQRGIFKNLCSAKLYQKIEERKKFLGVLIAFTSATMLEES